MSNTQYSYELQSIQLPLQLIKDIDSQGYQLFKDFKGLHHSSLQSRTSTLQGQQLFKDIDSTTRTTSTLQGLHHSSLQSRTSTLQGQQLFKDIDSTTRTTSTLQGLHHSSLQSRTSTHQGHRLFKDIDTTTRPRLHHFTAITLISLWPQYWSTMTFCDTKQALQTNTDLALARMKKEI